MAASASSALAARGRVGPHPRTPGRDRAAAGLPVGATDARRYWRWWRGRSRRRLPRQPIHAGCVLIKRDHLANVTSLAHERWKRAHPEVSV